MLQPLHVWDVLLDAVLAQQRHFCKDAEKAANVWVEDQRLLAPFLRMVQAQIGVWQLRTWSRALTRALRASLLMVTVRLGEMVASTRTARR